MQNTSKLHQPTPKTAKQTILLQSSLISSHSDSELAAAFAKGCGRKPDRVVEQLGHFSVSERLAQCHLRLWKGWCVELPRFQTAKDSILVKW